MPRVLTAKISIPQLPAGYVDRERLTRQWYRGRARRLCLVTAGAGYGKTTFLAGRARECARGCLWYAVDELDHDPAVFLSHLGAVLKIPEPAMAGGALDLGEPRVLQRMLASIAHGLQGEASPEMLVLDDLHLLPESSRTLGLLNRLIRYAPDTCRVVLASREPVGIATGRLHSQGRVARMSAQDLAFRENELQELFAKRFPGERLGPSLARRILGRTEGWAAGIEVLLQALDGASDEAVTHALDRLEAHGSQWFDYFAEEVLQRLDEPMRDFLLRSAVFPRLEPRMCNQVLGIRTSQTLLQQAADRNIFTFALAESGAGYRYHHLFREFLLSRLRVSLPPRRLRSLYRQAARSLSRGGAWAEAASCLAEGGDHVALLALLSKQGDKLLAGGQHQVLERALESLPPGKLRTSADALMIQGRVLDIRGDWDEAERCYRRAIKRCTRSGRLAELKDLLAHLLLRRGKYRACLRLSRQLLTELGKRHPNLRGQLLTNMGLAYCEMGRLREGEDAFLEAQRLFRQGGDRAAEGRVHYLLAANVHYRRGDFRRAREAARRSILVFRKIHDPRRLCLSLGVLGFITAVVGSVREARALTHRAARMAEGLEYPVVLGYCHHSFALCDLLEGDDAAARAHFAEAIEIADALGEPALRVMARLGLAECDWRSTGARRQPPGRGRGQGAGRVERACREILALAREIGDPFTEARTRILLGQVAWAQKPRSAQHHWREAQTQLQRLGGVYDHHRLLLVRLALGGYGPAEEAEHLRALIEGTAVHEHDFLFTRIDPAGGARVLTRALALGIQPRHVGNLLVQLGDDALPPLIEMLDALEPGADEVRLRAVDVLSQIPGRPARQLLERLAAPTAGRETPAEKASEASPERSAAREAIRELERQPRAPLRIVALGGLEVSVGERELGPSAWRSVRARRLFQLLLLHRFRWVPREVILESLWPETDPERGANNLWQTMHVLRRTLEPTLKEARQSAYIRTREEGCRLAPGDGHRFDVEAFEQAVSAGDRHWHHGRGRPAENAWREAVELYRGDLFAESPYVEFTIPDRERLRELFLRCLMHLLDGCERGKRWDECAALSRRALELDPYQEELHRHRIQALLALGHRREGLEAYHAYEKMMVREMGLMPNRAMRSLAERIVGAGG